VFSGTISEIFVNRFPGHDSATGDYCVPNTPLRVGFEWS